jgi:hypothetical protein
LNLMGVLHHSTEYMCGCMYYVNFARLQVKKGQRRRRKMVRVGWWLGNWLIGRIGGQAPGSRPKPGSGYSVYWGKYN